MSLIDEAHGALLAWAAVQERTERHPEYADEPHFSRHNRWLCSLSEGIPMLDDKGSSVTCLSCAVARLAVTARRPHQPVLSKEHGERPAWRHARTVADHWSAQGHPAAVHMQRIARELELRYGLGIEVQP